MLNMRFHCGFTFNWETLKKWILPILIGVLILFSQKLTVYAFDIGQYKPVGQDLVWSNAPNSTFNYLITSQQGASYTFDSPYLVQNDILIFPFSMGFTSSYSNTSPSSSITYWYREVKDFIVYAMTNDSIGYIPCQIDEGMVICSAKGYTIQGINFRFQINHTGLPGVGNIQADGNNLWIRFDQRVHTFDFINSSQSIIDNQNDNTQAIIDSQNGINDSLNDSNVDSSSTNGGGFFDNFSVDDSRGFSSIITAPLQFLRDLLTSSSSCSPLTFSLTMSDDNISRSNNGLSLPCGEVLWSRVPSSIGLLWVTLIWGLVGYRLLIDMIKFINNSLNPEYSKEYFLDL